MAVASRTPSHGGAWAFLIFVGAACALAYPAFGGAFLAPPQSDQYIGAYAVREFGTALLRAGHLPLWNPYLFGGMPFVGAFDGDIFYPPTLLMRLVLRTDVAVTWAFIVHVILAGWFTFIWLRATGLGAAPALIGGLAYELGGPLSSYALPGHDGKLYVSAILPLTLWLILRGVGEGRRWTWPVLALVIGCAALSPHPQLFQYLLLTMGVYALFVAGGVGRGGRPLPAKRVSRSAIVGRLATTLGAVLLGLAMSAAQYLPVAQFVAWSPRGSASTGAGTYSYATQFSMPIEDLANVYLPQFTGMLERYWGGLGTHWSSEYLGASVLVLAGAAIVAGPVERRRAVRFWLAMAVAATVWSLGGHTPAYHLVYWLVPGTPFFRVPAAAFIVVGLAVAALAADGASSVLHREVRVRYAVACAAVATLVALPPVVSAATHWAAQAFGAPWTPGAAVANLGAASAGALRCLVIVLLVAGVMAARRVGRVSAPTTAVMLALVVAVDLWTIERQYWRFVPPAARTFAGDAAIDTVLRDPQPVRVLAWPLGHADRHHDPELAGDALMIHHVRQVLGYHGNGVKRYDDLSWTTDRSQPLLTPHFWRLLNVGYILTDTAALPYAGASRVVGPIQDAAGDTVYLYRLAGAHPLAWLTAAARSLPDTFARIQVTDPNFDLGRLALIDSAAHLRTPDSIGVAPDIPVTATRYSPGHIQLTLARPAPAGTTLVVSENYYPGWTARANGAAVAVWRADYTLIGVPLPAGATMVDLRFSSSVVRLGLVVSIAACVAALVWLLLARSPSRPPS